MAEIVISVVAKVAEYLVEPVIHQGRYLFCYDKIFKNLEDEKKELMLTRENVFIQVEEAQKKTERIEQVVEKWLNDAQSLLEEVEELEQQVKLNNNCFQGGCPTLGRYHLCKKMVEKTKMIIEVNNKSNFKAFARLVALPSVGYTSIEDFVLFKSTKLAYDQLLEALQDDGIYRIGLFGMGGCGKTTLVTEVGKMARESNLFNQVVAVTMSQSPNIRNMQGQMADMLNIRLEEETNGGRSQRLYLRLKQEKRILIIVDDVWGEFNLKDIGITSDICHNGNCKVILTTRLQQVCTLMNCQKKIPLELLNEDEAWDLFRKHAHIDDQSSLSLLNSVAWDVARECKGLHIAIQAVGRSLKGQSIHEWKFALESLRSSRRVDGENGQRDAFSCLKLSYDYLKEENRLLFLMCCIFPEDHIFSIEDLIRCGVGLGVCRDYYSFDSARNQVMVGINKLVDSCLLMYCESYRRKKVLKMHDTIRDFGLWIASKEGRAIMVNLTNDLNSWIGDGAIKNHFAISSWCPHTNQISNQLFASKLEILWIETNSSLDLSSTSFEGLQGLKVMVLICNGGSNHDLSLSSSIESLTNLQTLCLRRWKLGELSFIVRLIRLEILDLQCCFFNELPDETGKLKKLKLLDLSRCAILENYESTGELSQIEELYISGGWDGRKWVVPSTSFVDNITATNLQRYVLKLGNLDTYMFSEDLIMRALYLPSINISSLSASMKKFLQRAEHVHFCRLHGRYKNLIPNIVEAVGSMNDLKVLRLDGCLEMECILDTVSNHADVELPVLVKLYLKDLPNVKEVCRGPPALTFFEKLQQLYINECPLLHNIFTRECKLPNLKILRIGSYLGNSRSTNCIAEALFPLSVARSLAQLELLSIGCREELKHIITEEEDGDGGNIREEIVPASHNSDLILPNLKELSVYHCDQLEFILPISGAEGLSVLGAALDENQQKRVISKLENLNLDMLPELKSIWTIPTASPILSFQYLQKLNVRKCDKLKCLFTKVIYRNLPELTSLTVDKCEELEEIMEEDEELENVLSNAQVCFPKLKMIQISLCRKLKNIFHVTLARMLPQLCTLYISCADKLEVVFRKSRDHTSNAQEIVVPNLKEINLFQLPCFIGICPGLKLQAKNLANMVIDDCPKFALITEAAQAHHRTQEAYATNDSPLTNEEQEMNVIKSVQWMYLKHMQYLKCIWEQPTSISFENLICLRVSGCRKLKFIFSSGINRSLCLLQLKYLYVENCEDLKEIISEYPNQVQEWGSINTSKAHFQQVCFPKLVYLNIWRCSKLKSVFSISMFKHLPQLGHMEIRNCSQLEQVFCCPSEANDEVFKETELVLPKLEVLILRRLPCLTQVFGGSNQLQLPALQQFRVMDCPNFSSTTCAALESFQLPPQGNSSDLDFEIGKDEEGADLYDKFLRPNYDSESEESCRKNKRHMGKYGCSIELQEKSKTGENIICPDGWFRVYFDVVTTQGESWATALLVNHEGKLIGARTRKLSTKFLIEQEALAVELAVELACDVVPQSNISVEGDCEWGISVLHDCLNGEVDYKVWYFMPILMNVRDKLGSMGDCVGKRICRNVNWVAYNVAKWAAFCNNEGDVLDSVPGIEVLSRKDFVSIFFTNDGDERDHGSLLNSCSDKEDDIDDGLLPPKMEEAVKEEL